MYILCEVRLGVICTLSDGEKITWYDLSEMYYINK